MREVTKEEMYKAFWTKDAVLSIDTTKGYPYDAYWKTRQGVILAKQTSSREKAGDPIISKYYINENH